jgi:glutathione S-transferase
MPNFSAIVTLLAVLFYFYTSVAVGKARAKYGIKAPAVTGHPEFERYFRIQMNMLEWMPIFLTCLWLFALYINDAAASAVGLVWVLGRVLYYRDYAQAAEKRGRGFGIQVLASGILFVGAFIGVAARIVSGT